MSAIVKRPLVLFGAAFLATVAAALFAFPLLLFALPLAFAAVVTRLQPPVLRAVFGGCLAGALCAACFAVQAVRQQALVGQQLAIQADVLIHNGQPLLLAQLPQGGQVLLVPAHPLADVQTGDSLSCRVLITAREYSSRLLSGGTALACTVEESKLLPPGNQPLAVRLALLREQLVLRLLALDSSPTTAISAGILFSYRAAIPPQVRQSFSRSGMSHILAASGLHLSILLWSINAVAGALGAGKRIRVLLGCVAAVLLLIATGMPVSMLRAAIMAGMGFAAQTLGRRSDGLTSVAVASVLLVMLCPPVLAELSFQLSFLAVTGILVAAPPLAQRFACWHTAWRGHCGEKAQLLYSALAASVAAQLFTAPVVGWQFGAVPFTAAVAGLLGIPLTYPVLLLGQLSLGAYALGLVPLATLLLRAANFFASLLVSLAQLAEKLPLATLPTLFPADWLPLLALGGLAAAIALLPVHSRRLHCTAGLCVALFVLFAGANSLYRSHHVVITSSTRTGSLIVTTPQGSAVLCSQPQSDYYRSLDDRARERAGDGGDPLLLVQAGAQTAPVQLTAGIWLVPTSPFTMEMEVYGTKIVKCFAVYDTIIKYGGSIPAAAAAIADMDGNLFSPSGSYILRRWDGTGCVRIPIDQAR